LSFFGDNTSGRDYDRRNGMVLVKYYKAYNLSQMQGSRHFESLSERARSAFGAGAGDEPIIYVRDDLVVVDAPIEGAAVLHEDITDEWRSFCENSLGFAVPDYVAREPGLEGDPV
jgi:hypothetical protein